MVFVDCHEEGEREWKRVPEEDAREQGMKIILCSKRGCGDPAWSLDHYYPWYNDGNLCELHYKGGHKKRKKNGNT